MTLITSEESALKEPENCLNYLREQVKAHNLEHDGNLPLPVRVSKVLRVQLGWGNGDVVEAYCEDEYARLGVLTSKSRAVAIGRSGAEIVQSVSWNYDYFGDFHD